MLSRSITRRGKNLIRRVFLSPAGHFEKFLKTSQYLGDLLTNLEKIRGTDDQTQKLINKAKAALQVRIASLQSP